MSQHGQTPPRTSLLWASSVLSAMSGSVLYCRIQITHTHVPNHPTGKKMAAYVLLLVRVLHQAVHIQSMSSTVPGPGTDDQRAVLLVLLCTDLKTRPIVRTYDREAARTQIPTQIPTQTQTRLFCFQTSVVRMGLHLHAAPHHANVQSLD